MDHDESEGANMVIFMVGGAVLLILLLLGGGAFFFLMRSEGMGEGGPPVEVMDKAVLEAPAPEVMEAPVPAPPVEGKAQNNPPQAPEPQPKEVPPVPKK
jgi:hypothetical protein